MISIISGALSIFYCAKIPSIDFYAVYKKKHELLDSIQSPRIIFVSGSNLVMGLDSKRISDSLHINVINNALTIQLGLRFMIDDVEQCIKEGDILVIAPEYQHFFGEADGNSEGQFTRIISKSPIEKWNKLNLRQRENVMMGFYFNSIKKYKYFVKNFQLPFNYTLNEYGDEVGHWVCEGNSGIGAYDMDTPFDENFAIYFINKVADIEKKAKVVIMPPVLIGESRNTCKSQIDELSRFLKKHGHPFIVEPAEHEFSVKYAFDTPYHLTKDGVDIFTGKVIEELRPYVGGGK
jgi:hypothetical protein